MHRVRLIAAILCVLLFGNGLMHASFGCVVTTRGNHSTQPAMPCHETKPPACCGQPDTAVATSSSVRSVDAIEAVGFVVATVGPALSASLATPRSHSGLQARHKTPPDVSSVRPHLLFATLLV